MYKGFLSTFLLIVVFLFLPQTIYAHPGRTASDGCHFCKTNCDSWGYTYSTRHGHNGEVCNPSKGTIDPLYGGAVMPPIDTVTPKPTLKPTSTPKPTIIPTETPEPTVVPTPTPEVKGEATSESEQTVAPSPLVESDNESDNLNMGGAVGVVAVAGLGYYLYKRFKTKKGGEK